MNNTDTSENSTSEVDQILGDALAQEEAMLASARPVLKHLLSGNGHLLLSEQIVARVNAMLQHIARQLLFALAEAGEAEDREVFAEERGAALAGRLSSEPDMLAHLHALAAEDMATAKAQGAGNSDPVLSPLLQQLAGSKDAEIADKAMGVVAAQARFIQQQIRMELPLAELPGDQFHAALLALADVGDDNLAALDAAVRGLRASYDEGETRLGRITNLLMRLGGDDGDLGEEGSETSALDLDHAGVALFSSANALASQQDRARIVMAFNRGQSARFALSLRAAGMDQATLERHFFAIHPDAELLEGLADIDAERAASLLASSHSATAK